MSWPTCRWKPQAADQQGTVLGVSWGRWGFWIPWIYSCMPCMHRYLNLWWTEWSPLPWISSFWGVTFHLLRWLLHCVLCIRRFKHSHKPPTLQRRRLHPACAMGAAPLYSQTGPNLLNQPIAVALTTSEFQRLPTQISLGLGPHPFNLSRVFQHCHSPKVFEHRCHRCRHGVAGCWRPPAREASSGWRSTSWADAGRDVGPTFLKQLSKMIVLRLFPVSNICKMTRSL